MKYGKNKTSQICKFLGQGLGRVDSCILSDISYETFTEWMKKSEFSESIEKAEIKCKKTNLAIIQKAAKKTWTAAAWILERKFYSEFGDKRKLEHEFPQNIASYLMKAAKEAEKGTK